MKNIEIERKFIIKSLADIPYDLSHLKKIDMMQAYLYDDPVIRIRKENHDYFLTYKGKGLMVREEYNLPINETCFLSLLAKAEGFIIKKNRYILPIGDFNIEIDIFEDDFKGLILAEIEFPDENTANSYTLPPWLNNEVTNVKYYHNSYLSKYGIKI